MDILKKLTPAETYFIMHRGAISHKNYLRYTFMDLILKGVLKITEVEKQASAREKPRFFPYVESGSKFSNYQPLPHEAPLITSFKFEDNMRVQLNNFIKISRSNTDNYKQLLCLSPTVAQYLHQSFIQRYITLQYSYKNGGETIAKNMLRYFSDLDDWLIKPGNEHRYPEIIEQIGNNIILANNFSRSFFEVFDKELKKQNQPNDNQEDYDTGGWTYWGDSDRQFEYFDKDNDTSWDFDSSFDSGSSGCSGDGCSGDSGCSGCGGCGGGD